MIYSLPVSNPGLPAGVTERDISGPPERRAPLSERARDRIIRRFLEDNAEEIGLALAYRDLRELASLADNLREELADARPYL